jgi:SAM-dependent methyltransferase
MDQPTIAFYEANATTVAARYESVVSSLSDHFSSAFRPQSKLLDIGFGSGRDLAVLIEQGHDCYGVDPTKELITEAQAYHPELSGRLMQGALPELLPPFGGGFDGVLCSAPAPRMRYDPSASASQVQRDYLEFSSLGAVWAICCRSMRQVNRANGIREIKIDKFE